jgi:hypothetical protein
MSIVMQPARTGPGLVPLVGYQNYKTAEAIVIGTVLIYDTGELAVAGADPALIAGVALQAAGTAPGYDAGNSPVPITGRQQKIAMAAADRNTVYSATLTNNSSTRIAPVAADVGINYGITVYSGVWTVDKNKTAANARVQIVGYSIDISPGIVFFKWITDHIYGAA